MASGLVNMSLNPSDTVLTASPDWTRLDGDTYRVTSITVDRGRQFELDTTSTGSATFTMVDTTGDWDPTYTGGAFYGILAPYRQVLIQLPDSSGSTWGAIFRGYVSSWRYEYYQTEKIGFVTVECVDFLDLLANAELQADGSFGDSVDTNGNIVYNSDTATTAVRTRIKKVLHDVAVEMTGADWPVGLQNIYTGNVGLFESVYTTRTSALAVIRDAADAEFVAVSNFFVDREGVVKFRGRYARFDYSDPSYDIDVWYLGDDAAANGSPSTIVRVSPPFEFSLDKENVYTAASALPDDNVNTLASADISGNYVVDTTAAAKYGLRTWSAENLCTSNGSGSTTALQETKLQADYVLANYKEPRIRLGGLTVRTQDPNGTYGDATWALLSGIDLSDVVEFTFTPNWGGGFSSWTGFVEGLHYEIKPMQSLTVPEVTLTLDVSPQAYFTTDSFRS